MLGGETAVRMSRKPDIMADAAYLVLTRDSREETGQFLIDDEVLKQHGITDMDQYANAPGETLAELPDPSSNPLVSFSIVPSPAVYSGNLDI